MSALEPARTVEYESVSQSRYDKDRAMVADISGIDVAAIKGYVLVVDDGSRQAVVTTDLAHPECAALLFQVTEILLEAAP